MIALAACLLFGAVWLGLSRRGDPRSISTAALEGMASLSGPAQREWLSAMLAEHAAIPDPRTARRFARGCLLAVLRSRPARDRTSSFVAGLVAAIATGAIALSVYGLLRYPEVRSGRLWIIYLVGFVGLVAIYGLIGTHMAELGSTRIRLLGIGAGLPAILLGWWAAHANTVVSGAVAPAAVLPALVVATYTAKRAGQAGEVVIVSCEAGIVGGLSTFIAYVTTAYVTGSSGAAVSDELSGAVFLLAAIPILTMVAGAAVATLARPAAG